MIHNKNRIESYLDDYNRKDIDAILVHFADDVIFESVSNVSGVIKANNKKELSELAFMSVEYFSERRQTVLSWVVDGSSWKTLSACHYAWALNGNIMFWRQEMTANKKTVETYMYGFIKSDHKQILSCLTDDVEWVLPGVFHLVGKDAFDKEIENDNFVGSPVITIKRILEENDIVVAEGKVVAEKKAGGYLNAVFCDVFIMENSKIKHLTSYLNEI